MASGTGDSARSDDVTRTDTRPEVLHYTYRISWSADDAEYVATCAEFPSLSWLAGSQVEALQGLEQLLRDVLTDMAAAGEPVPQPFAERKYSGKFNLRVGENLHRELAIHAAEDGLSLNQFVIRKLTSASTSSSATEEIPQSPSRAGAR